jgi:hypothetical protein
MEGENEVAPEVLGDCVLNQEDWSFFDDDIKAEMEKLQLQSAKKKRKLEAGSSKEGGDAEASTNDEMVNAKMELQKLKEEGKTIDKMVEDEKNTLNAYVE